MICWFFWGRDHIENTPSLNYVMHGNIKKEKDSETEKSIYYCYMRFFIGFNLQKPSPLFAHFPCIFKELLKIEIHKTFTTGWVVLLVIWQKNVSVRNSYPDFFLATAPVQSWSIRITLICWILFHFWKKIFYLTQCVCPSQLIYQQQQAAHFGLHSSGT